MSTASIVWGMLFGAIGGGYMIYGHRQKQIVALLCGLGLMVFPYFVTSTWAMLLVGGVLMAVPFRVRV
jgi:hypothetical protein